MNRLLIHVEGSSEESFVNEVLAPHLFTRGYTSVGARILGNARLRSHRGGIKPWRAVKRDLLNHLRGDRGCVATTMVDYYGLPATGDAAWPRRGDLAPSDHLQRADHVQAALLDEVAGELGEPHDSCRFVPFLVVHEFEGLLFSNCTAFANAIGEPSLARKLETIRRAFATPEHINDSPATAPSKRIQGLLPTYQKSLLGTIAALEIGLESIRRECPRFSRWLSELEALSGT